MSPELYLHKHRQYLGMSRSAGEDLLCRRPFVRPATLGSYRTRSPATVQSTGALHRMLALSHLHYEMTHAARHQGCQRHLFFLRRPAFLTHPLASTCSESYLGNLHTFDKIEEQVKAGNNVVLLSNHQTEADPAVMALLLEHSHPFLAENMVRRHRQQLLKEGEAKLDSWMQILIPASSNLTTVCKFGMDIRAYLHFRLTSGKANRRLSTRSPTSYRKSNILLRCFLAMTRHGPRL
jgi:hypothetical protein